MIGLLATTGMRVGEAIALDRTDLDAEHGVLVIRRGKFGKSREIPLDPTTQTALCDYAQRRDRLLPHPKSPALLLSSAGTRLLYSNVQHAFARLLELSGVGTDAARRPRIHDLRHTFAIKALLHWYRRGLEVEPRMARLSTYLGHCQPRVHVLISDGNTGADGALIQRVLAIPAKRCDHKLVSFLTEPEIKALLMAPDRTSWIGRRDHLLMLLAIQTGLRVAELASLRANQVVFGPGAHIRCQGWAARNASPPWARRWLRCCAVGCENKAQ